MLSRGRFAKVVNEQGFFIKFWGVVYLIYVLDGADKALMQAYVKFANAISVPFVLYQNIALIDFAYSINENLMNRYYKGRRIYAVLIVLITFAMLAVNIGVYMTILELFWLPECNYNLISLAINGGYLVLIPLLVLWRTRESGSMLTSAIVCLVFTYYNGLSLFAYSENNCLSFVIETNGLSFVFGPIIRILLKSAICFVTIDYSLPNQMLDDCNWIESRYAENSRWASGSSRYDSLNSSSKSKSHSKGSASRECLIYQTNYFRRFHFLMIIFAIHFTTLFNDWKIPDFQQTSWSEIFSASVYGFAVKAAVAVFLGLLYLWSLLAPVIFAHRDFE